MFSLLLSLDINIHLLSSNSHCIVNMNKHLDQVGIPTSQVCAVYLGDGHHQPTNLIEMFVHIYNAVAIGKKQMYNNLDKDNLSIQ